MRPSNATDKPREELVAELGGMMPGAETGHPARSIPARSLRSKLGKGLEESHQRDFPGRKQSLESPRLHPR